MTEKDKRKKASERKREHEKDGKEGTEKRMERKGKKE